MVFTVVVLVVSWFDIARILAPKRQGTSPLSPDQSAFSECKRRNKMMGLEAANGASPEVKSCWSLLLARGEMNDSRLTCGQ